MNELIKRLRSIDCAWSEDGELAAQAADEIERLEKERDEHLRSWNMVCKQLAECQAREAKLREVLGKFIYAMENCPDTEIYQSKEAYTHWISNFLLEPFSDGKKLAKEILK